jgi:rod shape-determining protein MreC
MIRAITSLQRPLVLLAVAMTAQVLLLAMQIKREGDVRLIRVWAVAAVTPLQRAGGWVVDSAGGAWNSYVGLRRVREENEKLRAELAQLKLRAAALESEALEARRLSSLMGFHERQAGVPMLAARVVASEISETQRAILIDRGARDGLKRNMGVVIPDGAVGKILEVYAATSQVQLLTDKEAGAGALLAGTRTLGIVRGSGEPVLQMAHVGYDEKVEVGERVLASGLDRIFPKDFPIGTVLSAERSSPFMVIRVKPAARLDRLEEVFVLLTQEIAPRREGQPSGAASGQAAGTDRRSASAKHVPPSPQ